jgi:hypothetical protein
LGSGGDLCSGDPRVLPSSWSRRDARIVGFLTEMNERRLHYLLSGRLFFGGGWGGGEQNPTHDKIRVNPSSPYGCLQVSTAVLYPTVHGGCMNGVEAARLG